MGKHHTPQDGGERGNRAVGLDEAAKIPAPNTLLQYDQQLRNGSAGIVMIGRGGNFKRTDLSTNGRRSFPETRATGLERMILYISPLEIVILETKNVRASMTMLDLGMHQKEAIGGFPD